MSIQAVFLTAALAATAPATSPAAAPVEAGDNTLTWLVGLTVLSIALMARSGVFRPGTIAGPDRVPRRGVAAGLLLVFIVGLSVWIFTQAFYSSTVAARWLAAGNVGPPNIEHIFTPRDYAILSTVPPMVAFVVLVIGDLLVGATVPASLGLSPRRLGRGALLGLLGILIIGPWVLWSGVASEILYRRFEYQHPMEHDLLRSLGHANERVWQVLIILGATVAAPLFEELLFRGHLQTLLRRGFLLMSRAGRAAMMPPPPAPPPGYALSVDDGISPASDVIPYAGSMTGPPAQPPQLIDSPRLPAWPSWLAVILTSMLFMSVHQPWSWPPILVLSLGLGYIYERTGNLWAPMCVHLLFNGLETLQYLILISGH